jgi:hypothetical protein
MAMPTQKRLWMNRSNWNSRTTYLSPHMKIAIENLSEPKMGVPWVSLDQRSLILRLPGAIYPCHLRHKGCNRYFPRRSP